MPKFSQESFSKLASCHMDLQVLFYDVIKFFDCEIIEGYRDEVEQDKAFDRGNSYFQWPYSKHNTTPAMAVDSAPCRIDLKDEKNMHWFAGYVIGIAQKLHDEAKITHHVKYRVNLNNESFIYLVHFELI